jgi:uncharacterized protein (UPF0276 family)
MDAHSFPAGIDVEQRLVRIIVRLFVRKRMRRRLRRRLRRMRRMRFGIGWRPELGAAILANLDRIDVVEVLAEEHVHAKAAEQRALRFLARSVPVVVHATTLGLASRDAVDRKRLDAVARVIGWIEPEIWSEHLAFVRSNGVEIGHLAAPPRNEATLEGLARNVETAARVIGSKPVLENVATLLDPPASEWSESEWLRRVLARADVDLLLDLHNLHANATNFSFSADAFLRDIPRDRVRIIHLAGGRRIEGNRILDDHLHEVPDPVFDLLPAAINERVDVILERDGNYPRFDELLAEVDRARATAARMAA